MLKFSTWIVFIVHILAVRCFPVIKQGILAITGVSTCGQSDGYCFVDVDCPSNENFSPDLTGHCDKLNAIYSSSSCFYCCRVKSNNESKISTWRADTSTISAIRSSMVEKIDNLSTDVKQEKSFHLSNGLNDLTRQNASFAAKNIHYELELEPYDNDTAKYENNNGIGMLKPSNVMKSSITPQIILSNANNSNVNTSDDGMTWSSQDSESNTNVTSSSGTINLSEIAVYDTNTENSTISGGRLSDHLFAAGSEKCLNITNSSQNDRKCVNIWKFINSKGVVLCFGTLLDPVWLLTSAACITKIFKEALDSVLVFNVKEKNRVYGISNVIVHENYAMHERADANNIGLVSLDNFVTGGCFACLPIQDSKYLDKICSIYEDYGNLSNEFDDLFVERLIPKCRDKLKALSIDSKMYLSISCLTERQSSVITKTRSGNVWCNNTLVGIETSKNYEDLRIFTPINEFTDWIMQNIRLYS